MRLVSRMPVRGRPDDADLGQAPVIDKDLTAPPGSPTLGDRYIVASVATGAWATHEDDIAQWGGSAWSFETPIIGVWLYVEDEKEYYSWNGTAWVQESAGPHASTHELGGTDQVDIIGLSWGEAQVYYVGKHGHDTNYDGKSINAPFLTIGKAVTEATGQTPSTSNRFVIKVLDAGVYTENVTLVAFVKLDAVAAKLIGKLSLVDNSAADVDSIVPPNDTDAVLRTGTLTGKAFLRAREIAVVSTGGLVVGIHTTSGILIFDVGQISATGTGGQAECVLGDGADVRVRGSVKHAIVEDYFGFVAVTGAKVTVELGDLEILTTGFGLNWDGANSQLRVKAGSIKDNGAGSAVNCSGTGGDGFLEIGEIDCDVAYALSSSPSMYLMVGKMSGTETNTSTGEVNVSQAGGQKPLNGFPNRTDSTAPAMSGANLEIAPSGTNFKIWSNGQVFTKSGTDSVAITNDKTLHFVYYSSVGVLTVSTTPWDIKSDAVLVATVYKDGANYAVTDERHGWRRNRDWHEWAHDTIGARYGSGFTGTFLDATFSIAQGVVVDEDIEFDSGGAKTDCQLWYRDVGLAAMRVELGLTTAYKPSGGGVLQYDNAGTLTDATVNRYVNSYVYATNDNAYPIVVVVGQAEHVTLTGAQNEPLPSILLSTAEWKILYRSTYRNVGGTPTHIADLDLRLVSTGPAQAATSASHAGLIDRENANQHPASAIAPDASGFVGMLSTADDTAQKALATLDNKAVKRITDADSPYTALATDRVIFADSDANPVAVSFPAGVDGKRYEVLNVGSSGNSVTITPNGAETIQGAATLALTDGKGFSGSYQATEGWREAQCTTGGGGVVTLIEATDDMAAILNAATSGSSFWLGDGSHVPSVPIDISGKDNISVYAGKGAVITAVLSAALDPLITLHTNSGIVFKDIRFALTSDAAGRAVFGFDDGADSSDIKIEGCTAVNSSAGFRTRFVSNALAAESITHLSVKDCSISGHWEDLVYMEVAATKTCDQLVVKDNNAVTTATAASEAAVILDDTTTGSITNSQVEGNYFEDFHYGVYLLGTIQTTVNDNLIIGGAISVFGDSQGDFTTVDGNVLFNTSTAGVSDIGDHSSICDNVIISSTVGIDDIRIHSVIDGNAIYSPTSTGIRITDDYVIITNNSIYDPGSYGVDINAQCCAAIGNFVFSAANTGIRIQDSDNAVMTNTTRVCGIGIKLEAGTARCVIQGNSVNLPTTYGIETNAGSDDADIRGNKIFSGTVAIRALGDRSLISGNTCHDQSGNAVELNTVVDCLVNGNMIDSANDNGIELVDVDTSLFTGNRCVDCTQYGIEVDANSDGNKFAANLLEGNTAGGLLNLGTNNEVNGKVENSVSTTDATVTTIATIEIPDDTTALIEVVVAAFRTNGADQAAYKNATLVYRRSAGNATIENATENIFTPIESDASWDMTIAVSGTTALLQVTGDAGLDINWKSRHTVEVVS